MENTSSYYEGFNWSRAIEIANGLLVDFNSLYAFKGGKFVKITSSEADLLAVLDYHPTPPYLLFSRVQALRAMTGPWRKKPTDEDIQAIVESAKKKGTIADGWVKHHVFHLRRDLGPNTVKNRWGFGYYLEPPEEGEVKGGF